MVRPPVPSVQLSCLDILVRGLAFCADHSWILAALNANLLGAIIMYSDHLDSRVHRYLAQIFEFLFASMVYYRVVSQAQNALSKVQSLAVASSFVKTPIFKDWLKFSKLAAERVKVLDEFNSQKPRRNRLTWQIDLPTKRSLNFGVLTCVNLCVD
jgi:hypothetical protein